MPTTPVLVTMWLDPPLQTDFQLGDSITWHAAFVDRQTRAPVTPDIINFIYSNPPQTTPVTVTTPAITVDATGVCHYDFPLSLEGKYVLTTVALGNPGAVSIGSQSMVITVWDPGN
jgi:hypothetical protein